MSQLVGFDAALKRFTGTIGARDGALLWNELSGADGRIRLASEEAVRRSLSEDPEQDLLRCWIGMREQRFENGIDMFYSGSGAVEGRLARPARAMIATRHGRCRGFYAQ